MFEHNVVEYTMAEYTTVVAGYTASSCTMVSIERTTVAAKSIIMAIAVVVFVLVGVLLLS